jgi:hypothetical protein
LTVQRALNLVKKQGVMLEAARGAVPNHVDLIAGGSREGSWWNHPRSREIFAVTRSVRDAPAQPFPDWVPNDVRRQAVMPLTG